jgi:hypothetical protein
MHAVSTALLFSLLFILQQTRSAAFFPVTPPRCIQPTFLYSSKHEDSNESVAPAPKMGTAISAENVGSMLFNEDILSSGRGDVRVGPTGRWKDFKGNEIVRTVETNPLETKSE